MSYCTVDDIRRFRLTDLTPEEMDDDTVQGYIDDAGGDIDAALANRYPVPFSPVPALVRTICMDLAAAAIVRYTHAGEAAATELPLFVRLQASGQKRLDGLRDGVLTLPDVAQHSHVQIAHFRPDGRTSLLEEFDLYREPRGWCPPRMGH